MAKLSVFCLFLSFIDFRDFRDHHGRGRGEKHIESIESVLLCKMKSPGFITVQLENAGAFKEVRSTQALIYTIYTILYTVIFL